MDINCLAVILAQATTSPAAGAQGGPPAWMQPAFLVLLVVMFYFLLIRPQNLKAKKQTEMLKTLKSGDKVGTASGIIGVVVTVKDNTVTLRSGDSKLELSKISITEIISSDSTTAS